MKLQFLEIIRHLDRFSSSFSAIESLDEMVQDVEAIFELIFDAEHTGLYLYDEDQRRLKLYYARGFNSDEWKEADRTAMERHPGYVFRKREMLYIPDTLLDDDHLSISSKRSFEVRSRLYIPVMNRDVAVGAFGVVDSKPNAFNQEDIAVLSFICNLAGVQYKYILNQQKLYSANQQIETLSKIPDENPNPVLRIQRDKQIIYANRPSQAILQKMGIALGGFIDARFCRDIDVIVNSKVPVEKEIQNGDKTFSFLFTPINNADYINVYGRDITEYKLAEHELKTMALIAQNTDNAVIVTNKAGEIEWVNEAFLRMTGYTYGEVKGQIPGKLLQGEETNKTTVAMLSEAVRNRQPIEVDIINYSKSGQKYWVKLQIQPVFDSEGELDHFISIQKDITREKQIEQSLLSTSAFQKAILNSSAVAIITTNLDGIIQSYNPAAERMLGYQPQEVIGLQTPILFHDKEELLRKARIGGTGTGSTKLFDFSDAQAGSDVKPKSGEFMFLNKSGSKFPVKLIVTSLRNDEGIITGYLAMAEDISAQKATDEGLKKLLRAVEQSPVMTYITSTEGVIEYINPKVEMVTGYSSTDLIGKKTSIFSSQTKAPNEYAHLWKTISLGKEWKGEFLNRKKSGELYWVNASISPIVDSAGKITHYLAIEEDITDRKLQYDALQLANLRFRLLISGMKAGVLVEDHERKVVLTNKTFCELFQIPLSPEQMLGFDCAQAAVSSAGLFKSPELFIQEIDTTLSNNQAVTNHILEMKNGLVLERDFIPIRDSGNRSHGILWVYRDITERKMSENSIIRQRVLLQGSADALNHLITNLSHDNAIAQAMQIIGNVTKCDRMFVMQNSAFDLNEEPVFNLRYYWTPQDSTFVKEIDKPLLINLINLCSKNNKKLTEIYGMTEEFSETQNKILKQLGILSTLILPINIDNRLWGVVGFDNCHQRAPWSADDQSTLKAFTASLGGRISRMIIEKKLDEARLIAENATKTKSDFLATMSHEIRTPMNGVIGMTSLLLHTQLDAVQQDYAETIKLSGEMLLGLINDILDFSKIESGKMVLEEQDFNLALAIEDVIDLTSTAALKKNLGLYYEIDEEIPPIIRGDLTRLRQILVNLTGNAIKFTHSGEILIKVKQVSCHGDLSYIRFSVKDTGVGIAPEKIDLLFKPFSQVDASTTRKYGGTGLGLAICSELVKLMHGKIWVHSIPDEGSEFIFTIQTSYAGSRQSGSDNTAVKSLAGKQIFVAGAGYTEAGIVLHMYDRYHAKTSSFDKLSMAVKMASVNPEESLLVLCNLPKKNTEDALLLNALPSTLSVIQIIVPSNNSCFQLPNSLHVQSINKPFKNSKLIQVAEQLFTTNKSNQASTKIKSNQELKLAQNYPLSLLVAEDNTINQKLIVSLFKMLGYTVHIAANGIEVLQTLRQMNIDLIFMDVQMPEMDGLEATRRIAMEWGDKRPLIVALTANAMQSDRDMCLAAGMDDYLSKPLTIQQVSEGIVKWFPMCQKNKK